MWAERSSRRFIKSGSFYPMSHWAFLFLTDFTDFHRCITLLSCDMTNAKICGDLWDLCDSLPRWFLLTDFHRFPQMYNPPIGRHENARICGDLWDLCDTLPRWFLLTDFTDLHRCITLLSGDMTNARICGDLWERFNAPSMMALRR